MCSSKKCLLEDNNGKHGSWSERSGQLFLRVDVDEKQMQLTYMSNRVQLKTSKKLSELEKVHY